MKKTLVFLILLLLSFGLVKNAYAEESEQILLFNANLFVSNTGVVTVVEEITYDFGTNQRHGIFRDIKVKFENEDGDYFETPLKVLSIVNEKNTPYSYTESKKGQNVSLKIGDPNKTISGVHTYVISYEVEGAIERFSDHDEIYWNVTGNEWKVPIIKATATFHLPAEIDVAKIKTKCITGKLGSVDSNCTLRAQKQFNEYYFETAEPLTQGEGISTVLSFDQNLISLTPKVSTKYNPVNTDEVNPLFLLMTLVWYVILPIGVLVYYFKYGRDPKPTIDTVPVFFDEPKDNNVRLTPAEVGLIIDEEVDQSDISATIVDLAIRGFLKIKEENNKMLGLINTKDYILTKSDLHLTKNKYKLAEHEQYLLEKLFEDKTEIKTSELKYKFATYYKKLTKMLYSNTTNNGVFVKNPDKVRTTWIAIGMGSLITVNIPFGVISLLMASAMPRKTQKGVELTIHAKGLKKFLSSQEAQLEFQEQNWYMFEKLLPYAIAFKVTKTWADRFKDLTVENIPDWYTGTQAFNAVAFASTIDSFGTSVAQTMSATRSSGGYGSGFSGGSGGGFGGGGGGGSW
ncbi:MAG: DUF2207 domain-containing protein [Patescibacteria group bacterium]